MDIRRKKPTDMQGVKRSRSVHKGALSKSLGRLQDMPFDSLEEVQTLKTNDLKSILLSIAKTEAGLNLSFEEAQEFAPTDEEEEAVFQEEEQDIVDTFQQTISLAKTLGEQLLICKITLTNMATFTNDVEALQESLDSEPDQDKSTSLTRLQTLFFSMREKWAEADLPPEHPLQAEMDACGKKLTHMEGGALAARTRSLPTPSPSTSSFSSSFSSAAAMSHRYIELPKIKVPTFSGNIMGWSTFWSTFQSTVDDRSELTDSQKLNYLRQSITDPALQLLLNSPMETPDTYQDIVRELKDRFQKTREIHQALVKTITTLSNPKYTRADLRKTYDVFKTTISNLKSTKHYTIEAFLSSLLYAILPTRLQTPWDQATKTDKGVPPVDQLLSFIKDHAETLPATNQPAEPASKGNSNPKRKDANSNKGKNNVHVVSPAPTTQAPQKECRWECKLCPGEKHLLYFCPKWTSFSHAQKISHIGNHKLCSNCLGPGHTTAECRSLYRCRECRQKHHSSIHQPQSPSVNSISSSQQVPDALLTTAEVMLHGPNGETLQARALIDSGAGLSLITNRVAQLLNLPLAPAQLQLTVAQGKVTKPLKHKTNLQISSLHNQSRKMPCLPAVADTVTAVIPSQPISSVTDMPHLIGLQLADTTYNVPGVIDILLGADMASLIISPNDLPRRGKTTEPIAQSTIFGWTLSGPVPGFTRPSDSATAYCQLPTVQDEPTPPQEPTLESLLNAILHEDEGPKAADDIKQDDEVEKHYLDNLKYSAEEQRYEVALPKKQSISSLGESRPQAVARFIQTTRSAHRKRIHKQFQEGIQSYLTLGHAEEVPPEDKPPALAFWLPMHSVIKLSSTSTKLRVVFDGSAATTSGLSLNQALHVGPTIQATLSDTLLKFRTHNIALNADISKMYREIRLCPADKDLHRFVWREDPAAPLKDYRMTRVTFGVSASPFLAVRTLQQTAVDHGEDYPRATQHILESFYVDDFLGGADNPEEAIQLFHQLRAVLKKGGFDLRKWRSSSAEVLAHIPNNLQEHDPIKTSTAIHSTTHSKALGLHWDSTKDVMSPAISTATITSPTKRGLVSAIFKTYDVLGWMSPTTLQMKILIQGLWKSGKGWDDAAPEQTVKEYLNWKEELSILAERTLPRRYTANNPVDITLHGFGDASEAAYGAVVYFRATYSDQPPTTSLVISKTKLVKQSTKKAKAKEKEESEPENPEKQTIHRLELCAALLLTKLLTKVGSVLKINSTKWQAWSDSSTVLAWLDGRTRPHPVFIANRVRQILELTRPHNWLYVPTACNPADCASRGVSPTALFNLTLWWEGPPWLKEEPLPIPKQPPRKPLPDAGPPVNMIQTYHSVAEDICDLPQRYPHLIAIAAWCLRFTDRIQKGRPNPDDRTRRLTGKERMKAGQWMLGEAQRRAFPQDITRLKSGKELSRDSRLKYLTPFLDKDNLLRVEGRLGNSALPATLSHPIICDAKDPLMVKYFEHLHLILCHCGPSLLLAHSGAKLHILGARILSRRICNGCVTCRKCRPKTQGQFMADLPSPRVNASPPFTHCGMDYAGPFNIKMGYVRKPTILEAHVCVFVCLSTKAVHLEVVSDQTTPAFLAALQRFIARRGCPQHFYSDNGGNFVGARNSCRKLYEVLKKQQNDDDIQHFLATHHEIQWHNIPAYSPHMGGLWEAAVKGMKTHLKRVMGVMRFTFEELTTIICRIEACLNSRPLLPITSHSPDGLPVLTAGHFLTNRNPSIYPEDPAPLDNLRLLQKWNLCQGVVQQFWTRWSKEYLNSLQARTKWQSTTTNLQVDDVVAIKPVDKFLPCHWPLGRVSKTMPGKDGRVRVVELQTPTGYTQRARARLALIYRPGEEEQPRPREPVQTRSTSQV